MVGGTVRAQRVHATREAILVAAERLFAEHGLMAVSNRQISEAAGQGNTAAVGYHFGSKVDLVRAIIRKHTEQIEQVRAGLVAEAAGSTELRDWVACLVRPHVEHIAALERPTWFARFSAQVVTDPEFRAIMIDESFTAPSLLLAVDGVKRCMPEMPSEVWAERGDMARHLITQVIAERERALAEGTPTPRASWRDTATGVVDAIVGLWTAPVTSTMEQTREEKS